MDDINLGLYPWPWLCPLGLMTNYMDYSGVLVVTVELFWTVFHLLLPPPTPHLPPNHPLTILAQNCCVPSKNDLKWPKIKQLANSKPFNRSISTVLDGLTQAKTGYTNYKV